MGLILNNMENKYKTINVTLTYCFLNNDLFCLNLIQV